MLHEYNGTISGTAFVVPSGKAASLRLSFEDLEKLNEKALNTKGAVGLALMIVEGPSRTIDTKKGPKQVRRVYIDVDVAPEFRAAKAAVK